jgi:hypothetical protein
VLVEGAARVEAVGGDIGGEVEVVEAILLFVFVSTPCLYLVVAGCFAFWCCLPGVKLYCPTDVGLGFPC